jgi:tRNA(fMet)-specific endonuclease VapC
MSYQYMLDTNIISELVYDPRGKVSQRIQAVGSTAVCTSIIAACELKFGAAKRQSERLSQQVMSVLGSIAVLPLEYPADHYYGLIRSRLERRGEPISPNDFLIAAHALALDLTLVTANVREFQRVEGLRVENWL